MTEFEILRKARIISDPKTRTEFLHESCAGDSGLFSRIESLLRAENLSDLGSSIENDSYSSSKVDPNAGQEIVGSTSIVGSTGSADDPVQVMERGPQPGPDERIQSIDPFGSFERRDPSEPEASLIGKVIGGRYKLIGLIGEGGMGEVYLAEQSEPVKRRVALKLIKNGIDSRKVIARFDAERQALALMDHPSIARVYDGGMTDERLPYFVMELVSGPPITKFCDEARLSVNARLELMVSVCAAVQHAHQKRIMHRDLKPGNILVTTVDGRPVPKVIDFGVAKAIDFDLTDMTLWEAGAIVGTPAYMSPEQGNPLSMDIDTRTDVYALGIKTYELLVGSPPIDMNQFRQGAFLEILRMLREMEPPRPSTKLSHAEGLPNIAANRSIEPSKLAQSLRVELDWVVMKAIEKDRERRYETANALARDLQRYLADEVVEARPPSAGYRIRKFVARHKVETLAAAFVILSLVGGIVTSTVAMLHTSESLKKEKRANELARTEKERADRNFATARTALIDLGLRVSRIETRSGNPAEAETQRKEVLDSVLREINKFGPNLTEDRKLLYDSARLHRYTANIARLQNDFKAADADYQAAIPILTDLRQRDPSYWLYLAELVLLYRDRASVEEATGKLREAQVTLDQAYHLLKGWRPSPWEAHYEYPFFIALMEISRSAVANELGEFEHSLQFAGQARELIENLNPVNPKDRNPNESIFLASAIRYQALTYRERGELEKALKFYDEAIRLMNIPKAGDLNGDELNQRYKLQSERAAIAAEVPERKADALEELTQVISDLRKLVEDFPTQQMYRVTLGWAYLSRAELEVSLGKPKEAIDDSKNCGGPFALPGKPLTSSESSLMLGKCWLVRARAEKNAGAVNDSVHSFKFAVITLRKAATDFPSHHHLRRNLEIAEKWAADLK